MCQEAFEAFSHCFRTTCFASLKKLEIKPVESNKSSRLTDKQWVAICDQLRSGSCPQLECIQILAHILQRSCLPSLTHLDLSYNKINDASIQELNNRYADDVLSQVEVMNLSDNCIGNEGAFVIFDNIRHRQWCSMCDLNLERLAASAA